VSSLPQTDIVKIGDLLKNRKLTIPLYQRPYKWTTTNVIQLIEDIQRFSEKSAYRIGTVVIHREDDNLNIVDGQQRCVSLLLILKAIKEEYKNIQNPRIQSELESIVEQGFQPVFNNPVSHENILRNYREIKRLIPAFSEDTIQFLLEKCEVVQCVLTDVSEAFQFFDSQNARGKDLEPHDLLKAFHLRDFSDEEDQFKLEVTKTWENINTDELTELFSNFLYRIRSWARGKSARYFSKQDIYLFKGINIYSMKNHPYMESMKISHFYIDHFNNSLERDIARSKKKFPFQLDQTIINGRRFFEMIDHYYYEQKEVHDRLKENDIIKTLDSYPARHRTGDKYVRMMFNCALFYFLDKFLVIEGDKLNSAVIKIFIWAYSVRLNYQVVQLATVDNYAAREFNMFRLISDAHHPEEILNLYIPPVKGNNSSKTEDIVYIFREKNYYEER